MTKPYSEKSIESFKIAFGTVLIAIALLECLEPLESFAIIYKRMTKSIMEELEKERPDREKLDLLFQALIKLNDEHGC